MDNTDVTVADLEPRSTKTRGKKRKWREIEALKDRFELRKELQDMDIFNDYDFSDLDV